MWKGLNSTVVDCVNKALEAAQPYLDPSKATDIAPLGQSGDAPAAPAVQSSEKRLTQVVKTGSGVTVMTAQDWAETYPEIYASYLANSENSEVHDYTKDYPMIGVVYEGMAFSKFLTPCGNSGRRYPFSLSATAAATA